MTTLGDLADYWGEEEDYDEDFEGHDDGYGLMVDNSANVDHHNEEYSDEENNADYHTYGAGDFLKQGEKFNPKVAPAFDGEGSYFEYEEQVKDWNCITPHPEKIRGHLLRNKLTGSCLQYKGSMERKELSRVEADDQYPDLPVGVAYVLRMVKKNTLKGATSISCITSYASLT